jgi:ATP-binding cassette subfamily B protein
LNLRNIFISFISAEEVIRGNMTLGVLLGISYIVGQTNGPITQLVEFVKLAQDAKLSMERLQEIHERSEEPVCVTPVTALADQDIAVDNLSFQFEGKLSPFVLQNVSFTIPRGKVTAIVGVSGSGKTTFLKMLLKFYAPTTGNIMIGSLPLKSISPEIWRSHCGTVMQDGYLFSDTIAGNITMSDEIDYNRLNSVIEIVNLDRFMAQLPLGIHTKVGSGGAGLSGGQRQRILIARALYKAPAYLFLDEATSSLDATTEELIMKKLDHFFSKRTVLIIAHRMSTVKNADQIIVFDNGQIVEIGTHETLIRQQGRYFGLVRNQLELGV